MWLEFRCAMGKSRVKGTRPAHDWALPDVQLLGFSLCECCPKGVSELLQISDTTAFCKRPMSRQQFLQCFRGFLCRALVPPDQASAAGYNRLRRCFDEAEAQAIGSWTELPSGSGQQQAKRSQLISRHYTGGKVHISWMTKRKVCDAILNSRPAHGHELRARTYSGRGACFGTRLQLWPPVPLLLCRSPRSQCSSTKATLLRSAASSGIADDSTAVDWILQGSKRHIVRECDAGGRPGQRFPSGSCLQRLRHRQAVAALWCSKCLGRMPGPQAKHIRTQLE